MAIYVISTLRLLNNQMRRILNKLIQNYQVAVEYNTIEIAIQYVLSNFNLLKNTFFNLRLTYY